MIKKVLTAKEDRVTELLVSGCWLLVEKDGPAKIQPATYKQLTRLFHKSVKIEKKWLPKARFCIRLLRSFDFAKNVPLCAPFPTENLVFDALSRRFRCEWRGRDIPSPQATSKTVL